MRIIKAFCSSVERSLPVVFYPCFPPIPEVIPKRNRGPFCHFEALFFSTTLPLHKKQVVSLYRAFLPQTFLLWMLTMIERVRFHIHGRKEQKPFLENKKPKKHIGFKP